MSDQFQPPYDPQQPPPYDAPPPPAYAPPPKEIFASFADRLVATLWDSFVYMLPAWLTQLVGAVLLVVGIVMADDPDTEDTGVILLIIGGVVLLIGVALGIWLLIKNYILRQGRTGYTYGKAKVGIRVVREIDGQPAGVGSAIGRYFLHAIINQACYLDYLWCLWDPRRQTLTDKVLSTVVVRQPAS